jgi:sec-independent protein translocase protein TatB
VKADIDKEIKAEELREIIEKQAALANPVHEIVEETRKDLNEIKQKTAQQVKEGQDALEDRQESDKKS